MVGKFPEIFNAHIAINKIGSDEMNRDWGELGASRSSFENLKPGDQFYDIYKKLYEKSLQKSEKTKKQSFAKRVRAFRKRVSQATAKTFDIEALGLAKALASYHEKYEEAFYYYQKVFLSEVDSLEKHQRVGAFREIARLFIDGKVPKINFRKYFETMRTLAEQDPEYSLYFADFLSERFVREFLDKNRISFSDGEAIDYYENVLSLLPAKPEKKEDSVLVYNAAKNLMDIYWSKAKGLLSQRKHEQKQVSDEEIYNLVGKGEYYFLFLSDLDPDGSNDRIHPDDMVMKPFFRRIKFTYEMN